MHLTNNHNWNLRVSALLAFLACWWAYGSHAGINGQDGETQVGLVNQVKSLAAKAETLNMRLQAIQAEVEALKSAASSNKASAAKANDSAEKAHSRIDGMKLNIGDSTQSPGWICGNEHKTGSDNLYFMYGARDGTGCGVENINYYKRLDLSIPGR